LCKNLAKRGHQVTVLTGKESERAKKKEVIEKFTLERYPWKDYGNLLLNRQSKGLALKKAFREKIGQEEFDLLHLNSAVAWQAVKGFDRLPKFQSFQSPLFEEELIEARKESRSPFNPKKYLKKLWLPISLKEIKSTEKKCYQAADKVFVLSEFMKGKLRDHFNLEAGKIKVLPGGVDVEKFKPGSQKKARLELGLPLKKKIVITSRRLVARMGLDNLIDAFGSVQEKIPESLLLITGDGRLRGELEKQARTLGLEKKIVFTGFVPEKDLPLYFQAADLFVLPTEKLEGFGLATVEAMATGLPALGTPIGATKEVLGHLDRALLFEGSGPKAMAKKMTRYLNKDNRSLKKKSRKYVLENYAWPKVVKKVEREYLKLVKE
jgi:glycosyltransferase involved in cell wall biosynthesis